ncbi:MAG: PGDYG domain-containing protein [Steroidobacterales bacterium]
MPAHQGMPVYHASGKPGHARVIADDPRHVRASKLECNVSVDIVAEPGQISTPEGSVHAAAGDAVVTDSTGDTWPVSRAYFPAKYRPVPPTVAGTSGTYVSIAQPVLALRMDEPFQVVLSDGISRLTGHQGDWLVDSGDGGMRIVSAAAFARTYRIGP